MNTDELVRYWVDSALEDFAVANHLRDSRDYLWCLFVAHLAVEKMLKGTVVAKTGEHAPPIHNLLRLAELADVTVNERLLAELTRFNIEARYPKDRQALKDLCTAEYTDGKLAEVRGVLEWMERAISKTF